MREIDRSNSQSDDRLASAMKSLASASPTDAPPEIADLLTGRFRRHHRRRKIQRFALAGLAACVVLSAGLLLKTQTASPSQTRTALTGQPPSHTTAVSSEAATRPSAQTAVRQARNVPAARVRAAQGAARNLSSTGNEFVALPAYNRTVRLEDTNVVRVEMPGNSLRLVGAPVNAGSSQSRVLADFVVGRDGTPYAVRLIAVRNTQ
jgi:hypothetical protein